MKNIQAVKIGNVVNISINGKLYKKNCGTVEEADTLFKAVLEAKENPTDENIQKIRMYINESFRVTTIPGFEYDPDTGLVFMKGFNTPVPHTLFEVIKEYDENNYPKEAIVNFWKLLMANPDKRVREDAFDFIQAHDFVLTDKGYMVVYKAVYVKESFDVDDVTKFAEFISTSYLKVKKDWKTSPKRYVVYTNINDDKYAITKKVTADKWEDGEVNIIGNLDDIFRELFELNEEKESEGQVKVPIFTDMYSRSMTIELGKPVRKDRYSCDGNPKKECSSGLHVGATKYVENFANSNSYVLVCYVNPANIVAVPEYDNSKMRVCEYFPFAIAKYENGKIDIIEEAYFESDYADYEEEELEKLLEDVKKKELPYKDAKNAEKEERPLDELQKIIESRLVDIV